MRREGWLMFAALAACAAPPAPRTVEPRPADYRGWRAYEMANPFGRLVVVPDLGGRVMSYRCDDHEYLWNNPALAGKLFPPEEHRPWKNYGGSKVWPAPQGTPRDPRHADRWPGPPDPVLDGGRYAGRVAPTSRGPAVEVVSPRDEFSGLQVTRRIALEEGSTRVWLANTFANVSDRDVTWGVWQVTQMDAGSAGPPGYNDRLWFYCPKGTGPKDGADGFQRMFGPKENATWQGEVRPGVLGARYRYVVGKIGALSPGGWAATVDEATGWAFVERFDYAPGARYPDDATVEMWSQGAGVIESGGEKIEFKADFAENPALIESEVLGPLTTLKPGERTTLTVMWGAARCRGPIVAVTSAGVVGERLTRDDRRKFLSVRGGRYGVFGPGAIDLVWEDAAGRAVDRDTAVATATPLDEQVVSWSQWRNWPAAVARVRVVWRPATGGADEELDALDLRKP